MIPPFHLLTHEFVPFTGGIGVYVQETAAALARLGAVVTVWAPDYGSRPADDYGFRVNRVPMRGHQDWPCRLRMAHALRHAFPRGHIPGTVILAEPGPVRLWMYPRILKLPVPDRLLIVLHGSEILSLSRLVHRKFLLGRLLQQASGVGVVSRAVGALVEKHYPASREKLLLVPGAVKSDWQDLPSVPRLLEGERRHILQVGRISPRKGQRVLVEALALLPKPLQGKLQVRIIGPVGKARYHRALQSRIRQLGLPVTLEGALPDKELRTLYEQADILVQPSQPYRSSLEGLGLTLLEAAHFGCSVIGTEVGGIPEAIRHDQTGLLVPPSDPHALARALTVLLEDAPRARQMGVAGSRFVRANFSWDRNARLLAGTQ